MKKTILILCVLGLSTLSFAKSAIKIDGKNHKCKGVVSIEDSVVLCDGQPVEKISKSWWVSEEKTVCGNEQVVQHEKGGGTKSVLANVFKGATLEKDVVVCGNSRIDPAAKLQGKTYITGSVRILGNSTIVDSSLSGSVEIHSSRLTDVEMSGTSSVRASKVEQSTISGSSKAIGAKIKEGSILQGSVEVKNSEIIGSVLQGASFIYDNSIIKNSVLRGAMKLQHCKFDQCEFMGATHMRNQTCKDNNLKY